MLPFSMKPSHVRLDQLNSGTAHVLESHSDYTTKDVLGIIEKGWIKDAVDELDARLRKVVPIKRVG